MEIITFIGVLSALVCLLAFIANQYHFISDESFAYDFLNMISAIGLLAYAIHTGALPFILTNIVWAVVSAIDVVKYIIYGKSTKKSSRHRR